MKKIICIGVLNCILSFQISAQKGTTCDNPLLIDCNSSYHLVQFNHHLAEAKEYLPCASGFKSVNDIWLELDISKSGNLEFQIIPDVEGSDIDFAIYDADLGCGQKKALRCSAAAPINEKEITGLDSKAKEVTEDPGNSKGQDGWLAKLLVSKNQRLLIYVHNFNGVNGATIKFKNSLSTPLGIHNYTVQEVRGNLDEVSYSLKSEEHPESVAWTFNETKDVITKEGMGPHIVSSNSLIGYRVLISPSKTCELELSNAMDDSDKKSENLTVYPNPARDITQLDLSNIEIRKITKIQCYQQGKLLQEIPNDRILEAKYQLDTRAFPKGMIDVMVLKIDGAVVNSRFINN